MDRSIRSAVCELCKENLFEDNAFDHLKKCVEKYSIIMLNSERTVVYDKYHILLYILGYGGEWNSLISLHVRNLYVYIFQIYEHFYHLCVGSLWKSILLESDDFIRLVLSSLEFPEDHFLEVPPSLSLRL